MSLKNIKNINDKNQDNVCKFCFKEFSTKSSLSHHQKTAKICLMEQGKINKSFKCDYCSKILSTQSRLNTHVDICKLKIKKDNDQSYELKEKDEFIYELKNDIKKMDKNLSKMKTEIDQYKTKLLDKEEYISKLEQLLKNANEAIIEMAKQPKTNTINTNSNNRIKTHIQNNFDITDIQKITNVIENHLTPEVISQGQKGLAEMLKQHLLQTENGELLYECTDVSRQKFEFINKDGIIETDSKATKLITSLNKANIYDKAHITGQKLWQMEDGSVNHEAQNIHLPKVVEVLGINQDSSKLRSHLASITSR